MRLWVDDLRPPPEGWRWARTAAEAVELLAGGEVEELSLDHDLGGDDRCGTGYDVASFVEEQAFLGRLRPLRWRTHSANPVGVARMTAALESADRFWRRERG